MTHKAEPQWDVDGAHKYFGVECNNQAWDLIEQEVRSDDDIDRMIAAAHTSAFHWQHVGTLVNHVRGYVVVVTAYIRAEMPESAMRFAHRMLVISGHAGDALASFDVACVHGAAMCVYRMVRDNEECARHHSIAMEAFAQCDADEKRVVHQMYGLEDAGA